MPSKGFLEALRGGDSVEIEPGIYARVNPKDRTLETSSGKKLPISEKYRAELFPDEKSRPIIEARDKVRKRVADSPLGEFGHQVTSGGIPGAAKDWFNFYKLGEDYLSNKAAENYVSQQISEQSPWTSAAATGTNIGLDLFLTRGMSGARAAPLLMGAQAGPRVLEEPMEVAGGMALGYGAGKVIDKLGEGFIDKISKRRALSREVAQEAPLTREINEMGAKRISLQNAQNQADFQLTKQEVNRKNIDAINQQKLDLAKWKTDISTADANHARDLKNFEATQKKIKQSYSNEVVRQAEKISNRFPQGSKISTEAFEPALWVENEIARTGLMNTPAGKRAANIVSDIFPEGKTMTPPQLSNAYRALEGHILKDTPEVSNLLLKYKDHLSERMPAVLSDSLAYSRITPSLEKETVQAAIKALEDINYRGRGVISKVQAEKLVRENLKRYFQLTNSKGFTEKVSSGSLFDDLSSKLFSPNQFNSVGELSKSELQFMKKNNISFDQIAGGAEEAYQQFMNAFNRNLNGFKTKYSTKADISKFDADRYLGGAPKKTLGVGPNLTPPVAPVQPPSPVAPNRIPEPLPPMPQSYQPIPERTLPPASNMAESIGDRFEQPLLKGNMTDNLMKLGFLKMLGGPATHAAEGAAAVGYMGMKGLTNPNIPGAAIARQGGLAAVDAMAQKYYSYHNGILDDPAERRSLTREIEDDQELSLEDKAVLQSKVNRGKSIYSSTL